MMTQIGLMMLLSGWTYIMLGNENTPKIIFLQKINFSAIFFWFFNILIFLYMVNLVITLPMLNIVQRNIILKKSSHKSAFTF